MNTTISISGLLKFSPVVLQGYGLVLGAGAVLIAGALLEKSFAKKSNMVLAETISTIIKLLLPFGFIGGLIYFVLNNPLL